MLVIKYTTVPNSVVEKYIISTWASSYILHHYEMYYIY